MAAGNAERTFFTVCGTSASQKRHYTTSSSHDNDEEEEEDDESDEESVAQRRRLISDEDEVDAGKNVRASIQAPIQYNSFRLVTFLV